ncbi:MAG TPA: PAS domain-containing protein [Candidatus Krumholzibacteria bacterium]|nr:PAS domain-containing protein [Candidatus Krumholzibacteria bacterium]HRX49973.1 PAS domain-containing protein [Candidatus Krumholzibacteria bacterium]
MTFTHKIMLMPLLAALAFGVLFTLGWRGASQGEQISRRIETEFYRQLELAHELELLAVRLPYTLQSAMTAGDEDLIAEAADQRDAFLATVARARALPGHKPADLDSLASVCEAYFEVGSTVTSELIEGDIEVIPEVRDRLGRMHRLHADLLERVRAVASSQEREMNVQLAAVTERARLFRNTIGVTIALCLLGLVVVAVAASWSILRPVRRLRAVAEDVARGDLQSPLDYRAGDDLGRLADAFRAMQTALRAEFSRREQAEAELRDSEERLAMAFEAANDGLWDYDMARGRPYFSPRYAEILGTTPEALPAGVEGIAELVHPEDRVVVDDAYAAHLRHGFPFDLEVRMRRADGSWCWVQMKAKISGRDAEGRPVRIVGTLNDISVRKEAEEQLVERTEELERTLHHLREAQTQLIQSEKLASLGQLAAGLAHELNNPIGALRASADVMARAQGRLDEVLEDAGCPELDPRLQRALRAMTEGRRNAAEAAGRVAELVGTLKSFSNLDQADLQRADPVRGLESALTVLRGELGDRIKVVRDYDDVPEITCYPADLNQMFLHVLRNAAAAIEGEGVITLGARTVAAGVELTVADTGRGIARDRLRRIFDLDFIDGDRVRVGWGMATIRQAVEKHRGDVRIDSEPGRGTTVTVTLPLHLS